uniref:Uncharacterized protein n=1 Tax=Nicotiana tabacum TaxID=4097 RepID=A0A1S4D320_TOBAC|nr:PREDICTED: uncharacterized protein LOC107825454 [Nicotiana tabacum]
MDRAPQDLVIDANFTLKIRRPKSGQIPATSPNTLFGHTTYFFGHLNYKMLSLSFAVVAAHLIVLLLILERDDSAVFVLLSAVQIQVPERSSEHFSADSVSVEDFEMVRTHATRQDG